MLVEDKDRVGMEDALSDCMRRLVSPHLLREDARAEVLDRADGAPMLQQQRRAPGDEVLDVSLHPEEDQSQYFRRHLAI